MRSPCRELLALTLLAALAGCERERRQFESWPPSASPSTAVREVDLQPGPPTPEMAVRGPYAGNAFGVSEGKRLYNQMNCTGCHFQGGGGIGPPLMDSEWIYGSAPENIFETIVEGRPNGMPSFRGRLSTDQVWQLVAYVRSMAGCSPRMWRAAGATTCRCAVRSSPRPRRSPKSRRSTGDPASRARAAVG